LGTVYWGLISITVAARTVSVSVVRRGLGASSDLYTA